VTPIDIASRLEIPPPVSGIGTTPEQLARLFQPVSQAEATTSRKYGGTGLGLVLSRRFCQMMGGDITVESEPGKGTAFTIRLPGEVWEADEKSRPATSPVPSSATAATLAG